jgi:hypothetical protein
MSSIQKRKRRNEVKEVVEEVVEEVIVEEVVEEVIVKEVVEEVVEVQRNNVLNIYKTVVTHLVSFDIIVIRVVPFVVASIDIQILTDTGYIYRTVNLTGDDYIKWSSDDNYLFMYVQENIEKVF